MSIHITWEQIERTFGVSNRILDSYIERKGIDDRFKEALRGRNIIVVHGSSKQGKTSLWKKHVDPKDRYPLNCGTITNIEDLHTQILKTAGFTITHQTSSSSTQPLIEASINTGLFGLKSKLGSSQTTATSREKISLNPADANDITNALREMHFTGTIIIDDFHYLSEETQDKFTRTLKTFYDDETLEVTFIIVGVWKEANRLVVYNGDLSSRIKTINADEWTDEQLRNVIEHGESKLGLQFEEEFKANLVHYSEGAVYLLQAACRTACIQHIGDKYANPQIVNGDAQVLIKHEIQNQSGRYEHFITDYSEDDRRQIHHVRKWIIAILISYIRHYPARNFVTLEELKEAVRALHPNSNNRTIGSLVTNLSQNLKNVSKRQQNIELKPPILSYDQNSHRLNVVDLGFLIWLRHTSLLTIDEAIGLPNRDGDIETFIDLLFDAQPISSMESCAIDRKDLT